MKGGIQGGNLAEVFRDLVVGRKSGLLFLRNGDRQKAIYLADGRIVNADSNAPEEGLGYRLLDEGKLTPQSLENALRRVEPGTSLRDVLGEGGAVPVAELDVIQKLLVQQIVASSFDWTQGTYEFQEGDFSYRGELELDTTSLLLDGVRRMFDFDAAREKLLSESRPLKSLQGPRSPLKLEPTEGFIYSRVDGTLSAADICALSIISEEMTCRVLAGLLAAGVITHLGGTAAAATASAPEARPAAEPSARTTSPSPPAPPPPSPPQPTAPRDPTPVSTPRPRVAEPRDPTPTSTARPFAGANFTPRGTPRVEAYQPAGTTAPTVNRSNTGSFERSPGSRGSTGSFDKPAGTAGRSTTGSFEKAGAAGGRPAAADAERASRARAASAPAGADWQRERVAEIDSLFDSLDRLNFYAVLGLPRDAPGSAVEEAFRRLAAKYHPNKNPWATDDAVRSKLVFIYAKVKSAYDTLRDDRKRIEHDEQIRRHEKESSTDIHVRMEFAKTDRQRAVEERVRESEGLFREAKKLVEAKSYHAAHERVVRAIDIYPEEARFFALAGKIEALNPNIRWQKDAESHLRKATELDPWNADYRVDLGHLYKNAGMRQKAKKEFIRALELDPVNELALAEIPAAERPAKKVVPTDAPSTEGEDVDWS